jgi:hypothetical protein
MKEFKGTPGPWSTKGCDTIFAPGEIEVAVALNYERIETLCSDVQIIAAAPELLAAIQQLLEIYDNQSGKLWTTSSKRRALDAAHAAIKKALGENQ